MKNFWIVVGVIVLVLVLYLIGRSLFPPTGGDELGPIDDGFDQISTTIPETTTAPAVVATGSPITSPELLELPISSSAPTASGDVVQ